MKIYKIDVNHITLEDLLKLSTKVKVKYRNTGVSFTIFNSETNESEEIGYIGCNFSEWAVNSAIRNTYKRLKASNNADEFKKK